jgi:hypothetical protein
VAWQVGWSHQLRCEDQLCRAFRHRCDCCCCRDGSVCRPVQGCCRGGLLQGVLTVTPDERVHRGVVLQLAAVASRNADHRERRVGEHRVLRERLFLGASVEDDPPVPAWPVSAGVAPFGLPVTWVGDALAVVASDAHPLRSVPDGSEPCCGVWMLRRVRAHSVWPAGKPVGWGFDSGQGPQLAWVLAAEVPGIGVEPVSEEAASEGAASERVPCEPASVVEPPVSVVLPSGERRPEARKVSRARRAVQEVAGAMRQHGSVRPEPALVSAALA